MSVSLILFSLAVYDIGVAFEQRSTPERFPSMAACLEKIVEEARALAQEKGANRAEFRAECREEEPRN